MTQPKSTDKYKYCNHHHELDEDHKIVDFGDGSFVANKEAIPLLRELNKLGLKTRTHHIKNGSHAFVSILLDNVNVEIKTVYEKDADRVKYNGKKELLLSWKPPEQDKGIKCNEFYSCVNPLLCKEIGYCQMNDINNKQELK